MLISTICMLACACSPKPAIADYAVVPLPQKQTTAGDGFFELNDRTRIVCRNHDEDMLRNARFLAEYIHDATGFAPESGDSTPSSNYISIDIDTALLPEGYTIHTTIDSVTITGGSSAGVFYGIQTIRKSMPVNAKAGVHFPTQSIEDAPFLSYRGVMLDEARRFFGMESVKRFIDILALHNMNVFHWHLTDDQGWRIEIERFPELTEKGAFRADTTASGIYGGYYTQDQIREVIDYARERYITIIPEIDMPGHMMAALAAFPEIGCTGGPYEITSQPGVRQDILCAGNPKTMAFVKEVLSEIIDLFPSEYIHIGGDESPRTTWEECRRCQSMIRKLGLKSDKQFSAEDRLQGYFNTQIEEFLAQHGRKLIGWDEIVAGGLSPEATVMSWRGTEGGIVAAQAGHDVIMTPNGSLYFDYYQSADISSEPATIGGYVPLKKVYDYNPVADGLTPQQAEHIIGVQANLWSTWMLSFDIVEYMLLPRLAALSEIAWNTDERKDFPKFLDRLDRLCIIYDREGYNYSHNFFDITGSAHADYETRTVALTLNSLDDTSIYYTTDGSEPTEKSTLYTSPIIISEQTSVRAVAIMPGGRRSTLFREEITFNKATLKPLTMLSDPAPRYAKNVLNDGLHGKEVFTLGNWAGYRPNDMEVVIDMEERTQFSQVVVTTLLDYGSHIMDATSIAVWVSDDGKEFTKIAGEDIPDIPYAARKRIIEHRLSFDPVEGRYVKIWAGLAKKLPEKQFGKAHTPFLFVDEIGIF